MLTNIVSLIIAHRFLTSPSVITVPSVVWVFPLSLALSIFTWQYNSTCYSPWHKRPYQPNLEHLWTQLITPCDMNDSTNQTWCSSKFNLLLSMTRMTVPTKYGVSVNSTCYCPRHMPNKHSVSNLFRFIHHGIVDHTNLIWSYCNPCHSLFVT